jgi:hypothetical protein
MPLLVLAAQVQPGATLVILTKNDSNDSRLVSESLRNDRQWQSMTV